MVLEGMWGIPVSPGSRLRGDSGLSLVRTGGPALPEPRLGWSPGFVPRGPSLTFPRNSHQGLGSTRSLGTEWCLYESWLREHGEDTPLPWSKGLFPRRRGADRLTAAAVPGRASWSPGWTNNRPGSLCSVEVAMASAGHREMTQAEEVPRSPGMRRKGCETHFRVQRQSS